MTTYHASFVVRGSMLARETVRCFRVVADGAAEALTLAETAAGRPRGGEWRVAPVDSQDTPRERVRELQAA